MFRRRVSSLFNRLPNRGASHAHEAHEEVFNEPGGKLWGREPLKPGEKRKWELWEYITWPTYVGGVVLAYVGLKANPNESLQEWAITEAAIRMEAREQAARLKTAEASD